MNKPVLTIGLISYWACVAFTLCFLFIGLFAVNGVWQDEWAYLPVLKDLQTGKLDYWQLFLLHQNEHRACVAIFALAIVASLLHYDGVAIQYAGLALMTVNVALMIYLTWRSLHKARLSLFWIVPVVTLGFSLRQWENLVCTNPFPPLLTTTAFLSMLLFLDGIEESQHFGARFAAALLAAFCCTFSFANGVLAYPLAFLFFCGRSVLRTYRVFAVDGWHDSGAGGCNPPLRDRDHDVVESMARIEGDSGRPFAVDGWHDSAAGGCNPPLRDRDHDVVESIARIGGDSGHALGGDEQRADAGRSNGRRSDGIFAIDRLARWRLMIGATILAAAAFASVLSCLLTLGDVHSTPVPYLSLGQLWRHPRFCGERLLASLATPLTGIAQQAVPLGAVLLAILFITCILILRQFSSLFSGQKSLHGQFQNDQRVSAASKLLLPASLMAFGLLSNALILYARVNMPLNALLASHYASILLVWIFGLYLTLINLGGSHPAFFTLIGVAKDLSVNYFPSRASTTESEPAALTRETESAPEFLTGKRAANFFRGPQFLLGILATLMVICPLLSIKEATQACEVIRSIRLVAANKLLNYNVQPDESLMDLCYSPKWVRIFAPYLEENRLSVFAETGQPPNDDLLLHTGPNNGALICHIEHASLALDKTLTETHPGPSVISYPVAQISGWIENGQRTMQIKAIFIKTAEGRFYKAAYGLYRPDLVRRFHKPALARAGFSFVCDPHKALTCSQPIAIIAQDRQGERYLVATVNFRAASDSKADAP